MLAREGLPSSFLERRLFIPRSVLDHHVSYLFGQFSLLLSFLHDGYYTQRPTLEAHAPRHETRAIQCHPTSVASANTSGMLLVVPLDLALDHWTPGIQ